MRLPNLSTQSECKHDSFYVKTKQLYCSSYLGSLSFLSPWRIDVDVMQLNRNLVIWCCLKVHHHACPNLVVVPPLCLVFGAHLANQLLYFGSPQWILCHHRVGITGSVDLLRRVVVCYLVGAVCTSPWRCLIIQPWRCSKIESQRKKIKMTIPCCFAKSESLVFNLRTTAPKLFLLLTNMWII